MENTNELRDTPTGLLVQNTFNKIFFVAFLKSQNLAATQKRKEKGAVIEPAGEDLAQLPDGRINNTKVQPNVNSKLS